MFPRKLARGVLAISIAAMGLCGVTVAAAVLSTQVAGAAPAPIKVGVMCSCTGAAGEAETLVTNSYLAWVKVTNASGGIAGHKIQLINENDQTNPGLAVTEAKTLVSDGVVAVEVSSLVQQAFLPILVSANVPVVGESFGIPGLPQNTDVFDPTDTLSTAVSTASQISIIKAAGVHKVADLYETSTTSAPAPAIIAAINATPGLKVVYSVATSLTQTNYESECLAAQQAGATGLLAGTGTPANIEATASSCSLQGYHPAYFAGTENWGPFPALAKNTWMTGETVPYFYTKNPAIKTFTSIMNKYYPGTFKNPTFDPGNSLGIYAGGLLLQHALIAGHLTSSTKPTAALVLKGLYSLKGDTLGGLAPPLTFKKGGDHAINCWYESHWLNGKPVIAHGGNAVCTSGGS
jgi:branched-chain amino acid transport system substrate-binding protein